MLDRSGFSSANCSIARTLDVVGEKWSLLVLREAFYGVRRFDDFIRTLGCPRDVLSARLKRLVAAGILDQRPYQDPGRRPRSEYFLTEKGVDLLPALLALMSWGDRWVADAEGPPIEVVHNGCGAPITVGLSCADGHTDLTAFNVHPEAGPGLIAVQQPASASASAS
jgi:DNA-binding HxlR family transcriptional regulator